MIGQESKVNADSFILSSLTTATATDMMAGDYSCSVIEIAGSRGQKIKITAATHIEVHEIQSHYFDPTPRCGHFFIQITDLLQLYNCVTHLHPELDENLNFVCRGTREEMVSHRASIKQA